MCVTRAAARSSQGQAALIDRIRNKIAASKKKGMWMGGFVPLGYTAKDRTLVVNATEAETVRDLFKLYLDHGSVRELKEVALKNGLRTRLGSPLARGHLYTLLRNPIYRGEIRHKDRRYPGLHAAIIDPATWAAVQRKLTENCNNHKTRTYAKEPSLLAGRLYDDQGRSFATDHAIKKGKRYRYYVERDTIDGAPDLKRGRRKRIPAEEIERLVITALKQLLCTPDELMGVVGESAAGECETVIKAGKYVADGLMDATVDCYAHVQSVVQSVRVYDGAVRIDVDRARLAQMLGSKTSNCEKTPHVIRLPVNLKLRGVELKLVIEGSGDERNPAPDAALIKALVRGHDWWNRLFAGKAKHLGDIAEAENVTPRYVRRLVRLAFLAPDITAAILDGRQPVELSAERLTTLASIPLNWVDQRTLLGF